ERVVAEAVYRAILARHALELDRDRTAQQPEVGADSVARRVVARAPAARGAGETEANSGHEYRVEGELADDGFAHLFVDVVHRLTGAVEHAEAVVDRPPRPAHR